MVYSPKGIPRAEALATQKRLATLFSYKLNQEYLKMRGFMRERILLAIVRSNSLLIRGTRDKGARIQRRTDMMDVVVMALPRLGGVKPQGGIRG